VLLQVERRLHEHHPWRCEGGVATDAFPIRRVVDHGDRAGADVSVKVVESRGCRVMPRGMQEPLGDLWGTQEDLDREFMLAAACVRRSEYPRVNAKGDGQRGRFDPPSGRVDSLP
jgi:hypothetical protein